MTRPNLANPQFDVHAEVIAQHSKPWVAADVRRIRTEQKPATGSVAVQTAEAIPAPRKSRLRIALAYLGLLLIVAVFAALAVYGMQVLA